MAELGGAYTSNIRTPTNTFIRADFLNRFRIFTISFVQR